MNYVIRDCELYHHGVKGMRWGIRKDISKKKQRKLKKSKPKNRVFTDINSARLARRIAIGQSWLESNRLHMQTHLNNMHIFNQQNEINNIINNHQMMNMHMMGMF